MERRDFVKSIPLAAVAPAALAGGNASNAQAQEKDAPAASVAGKDAGTDGYGKEDLREFAEIGHSDMSSKDADGNAKPGFKHSSSTPKKDDPKALYQMPLTKEEQDIMDGKKGPELAKVMKIVVAHGNAFNAERLVDLGGAPHSSLFTTAS